MGIVPFRLPVPAPVLARTALLLHPAQEGFLVVEEVPGVVVLVAVGSPNEFLYFH